MFRRAALSFYSLALYAFPAADRARYAHEMAAVFDDALTDTVRTQGRIAAVRFTLAACTDVVRAGIGDRRFPRDSMRIAFSWLDVKLGVRMLARYPGLSLAGGLGIVLVVLCGTVAGLFDAVINAGLPFDHGDRIVAIENWDTTVNRPAPHDFESWRADLGSVQEVGAWRLVTRNVSAASQPAEPERIAEISASAFSVARVPPLIGRYLLPTDESETAASVVVLGYDEWQRRFAADPRIVGRTLEIGGTMAAVVGVMPRGFGFPVNERYWMPLHDTALERDRRVAPSNMPYKSMPQGAVNVFGRLADGVSLAAAQAELDVIGQRLAADAQSMHAHVRPRVLPYTYWFFREQHDGEIVLVWGLVAILLGVVGANVAVLVYARTATRRIEIALRTAIGASRARIVGQMFVEGLVLSSAAAAAGLLIAVVAQRELAGTITWDQMPFWVNVNVTSPRVLVYVFAVAILGAVVVGAVPAIQATGRRAQLGLQQASSISSGWKIGRTYGALIVVQVALAVAILPYAFATAWTSLRNAHTDPGFPAAEFLTARIDVDSRATTRRDPRRDLVRRLEAEAAVSRVALLAGVPGAEPSADVELEGGGTYEVAAGDVAVDTFDALDVPVLAGRGFDRRDERGSTRVVVNRSFADEIAGGNAVGRRLRQAAPATAPAGPWLEITGVIPDVPATTPTHPGANATIYRPVAADDARLNVIAVRTRAGSPGALAARLREVATGVDGDLLLRDVRPMDAVLRDRQTGARLGAWAAGLATGSLLLLSATGLYALMAFTVTQRRREIGIRIALGAHPRAVVRGILSRALTQLIVGTAIGVAVAAAFNDATASDFTGGAGLEILPLVAGFVLSIGLAAAAVPARRALRIEPTEALRAQ